MPVLLSSSLLFSTPAVGVIVVVIIVVVLAVVVVVFAVFVELPLPMLLSSSLLGKL